MNADFLIRAATTADIPALHRLIELSVRRLSRDDYSPEQIDGALHTVLGLDTQLIEDATYFVAVPLTHPEILVGCGGWSYRQTLFGSDHAPNRATILLDPNKDYGRIRAIFVHPEWARRGLGTLLLKHCEDAAALAGFCRLEMGSTLTGAPLYRCKGYEVRERIDAPLPNGAALPILRMVKE